MDERKKEVYAAAEELYSVMNEAVKPENKEQWKEMVWNNVKDKSEDALKTFVNVTLMIARYNPGDDE